MPTATSSLSANFSSLPLPFLPPHRTSRSKAIPHYPRPVQHSFRLPRRISSCSFTHSFSPDDPDKCDSGLEPYHLVRHFFATLDGIGSATLYGLSSGRGYRRTLKEPIVVLSIKRPISNLTFHASRNSLEVMRKAFGQADRMLGEGRSWAEVCVLEDGSDVPYREFLNQHKVSIRLDVRFRGGSNSKGRAVGWTESHREF